MYQSGSLCLSLAITLLANCQHRWHVLINDDVLGVADAYAHAAHYF